MKLLWFRLFFTSIFHFRQKTSRFIERYHRVLNDILQHPNQFTIIDKYMKTLK